jgi:hypothetical protein
MVASEAKETPRRELEHEVERLRVTVEDLEASRNAALEEMRLLREQVEMLQVGMTEMARLSSTGLKATPQPGPPSSPTTIPEEQVGWEKEPGRRYQAEREILEQRGGVLLPAGQLVIEPGFQYSRFSRDRLDVLGLTLFEAIAIGRLEVSEISRDIYTPLVVARYGINDRIEFEVDVPYLFRSDRVISGAVDNYETKRLRGNGIGDITVGLFTHVFSESDWGWMPDTILSFRGKLPTGQDPFEVDADELPLGSGFWGFSSGFTLVKSLDPAVLFASGSYYWNLERDVGSSFGDIDPGNTVEYSLGLAFALNERLAMSFTHQHRITESSELEGSKLDRTDANAASLFLGLSYVLSQTTSVNFSLGVGITEDAPDLTLEVRVPFRLPQRGPSLRDFASLWSERAEPQQQSLLVQ